MPTVLATHLHFQPLLGYPPLGVPHVQSELAAVYSAGCIPCLTAERACALEFLFLFLALVPEGLTTDPLPQEQDRELFFLGAKHTNND